MSDLDLDILGKLKVVSQEEAEESDFVVCALEGTLTPFTDNESGFCAHCNKAIIFRPTAPKKPQKICFACAMDLDKSGRA